MASSGHHKILPAYRIFSWERVAIIELEFFLRHGRPFEHPFAKRSLRMWSYLFLTERRRNLGTEQQMTFDGGISWIRFEFLDFSEWANWDGMLFAAERGMDGIGKGMTFRLPFFLFLLDCLWFLLSSRYPTYLPSSPILLKYNIRHLIPYQTQSSQHTRTRPPYQPKKRKQDNSSHLPPFNG